MHTGQTQVDVPSSGIFCGVSSRLSLSQDNPFASTSDDEEVGDAWLDTGKGLQGMDADRKAIERAENEGLAEAANQQPLPPF